MPKVSFRMASASRESVFGVQTNTARKVHRSDHEGRLTTAPSGCCVRKGTSTGTRRASKTAADLSRAHLLVSPAPVLCLGDRALNGRPTGDAELGAARCRVIERLVGSDAVVDVAEAGRRHRERSAVLDRCPVEVLVLQRAEEAFDDAVGLG
jgi:hypothetical protein